MWQTDSTALAAYWLEAGVSFRSFWAFLSVAAALVDTVSFDYRIFTLGKDGHFTSVREIKCGSDDEAIADARQHLDGKDVEVWQLGRFIGLVSASGKADKSPRPSDKHRDIP
jgi:hypothetical protein